MTPAPTTPTTVTTFSPRSTRPRETDDPLSAARRAANKLADAPWRLSQLPARRPGRHPWHPHHRPEFATAGMRVGTGADRVTRRQMAATLVRGDRRNDHPGHDHARPRVVSTAARPQSDPRLLDDRAAAVYLHALRAGHLT